MSRLQLQRPMFNLITCTDLAGGIGYKGTLPWKYPRDMRNFKKLTTMNNATNVVIMGRKTFESLKKPLPGRINMVISSNPGLASKLNKHPNVVFFSSIRECVKICDSPLDNYFVIGGASIYKYFLDKDLIDRYYITIICKKYQCDTYIDHVPTRFNRVKYRYWDGVVDPKTNKKEPSAIYQVWAR